MTKIYPQYPRPVENKVSSLMTLFKKNRSWLDGLYAKSYTMKMGEVRMPGATLYIPNTPDLIHRVLVAEADKFPKNPLLHEVLEPLLGDSIFTTNGKVWKKQRELLAPSFEMVKIKHVFGLMNEAAKEMHRRLEALADGSYHDIDKEMTFTTADVIFRTILSSRLDEEEGMRVLNAFVTYQEASAKIGIQKMFLVPGLFRKRILTEYRKSGQVIREALGKIIKPRFERVEKDEESGKQDILHSLLQVIDEETGKPFSFKEILDQIAMLFLAGHETTASSMTWTLYLLSLYPEVQERAYEEVKSVCGDKEFTIEMIKRLDYLTSIFKESLRLYPPVSFFARVAAEDTVMRDKKIPKGSYIVVSPWLMHRNERYWEDPHMFDPERFTGQKKIQKGTYFPFGMGPRICIGAGFAMQEAPLLLATILRNYKVEMEPGFVPDVAGRLTLRTLNGLRIRLIRRS